MQKYLEKINVKNPCLENWDEMIGNEQEKFCKVCNKTAYNLSEMTEKRALKILSQEKVCIKFDHEENGKPIFQTNFSFFKCRLFQFATVMITAILSFTTIYAQQDNKKPKKKHLIRKTKKKITKPHFIGRLAPKENAIILPSNNRCKNIETQKNKTNESIFPKKKTQIFDDEPPPIPKKP